MQRILITGSTGYIGKNLVDSMLQQNKEVAAIVRKPTGFSHPNYTEYLYSGSAEEVYQAVEKSKPQIAIHLAAQTKPNVPIHEIDNFLESNLNFGIQLLESLKDHGCDKFIHAASYWEYNIDAEFFPRSLYTSCKTAFRYFMDYYCHMHNLKAISLVLYDVFGPFDFRNKFLTSLVKNALNGVEIKMTAGEQYVNYVYIEDVVKGIEKACELLQFNHSKNHLCYGLSSKNSIQLKDVIGILSGVLEKDLKADLGSVEYPDHQIYFPTSKIPNLPGWEPQFDIKKGLQDLVKKEFSDHPTL